MNMHSLSEWNSVCLVLALLYCNQCSILSKFCPHRILGIPQLTHGISSFVHTRVSGLVHHAPVLLYTGAPGGCIHTFSEYNADILIN